MKNLFSLVYSKILFIYQSIVKNFSSFHLILVLSTILYIYNYFYIDIQLYPIIFKLLVMNIIGIVLYYIIYNYRNLEISIFSFILFQLNFIIFAFYFISIYYLIKILWFGNLEGPVFIENISIFSQYRYLILVIISILGGLLFIYINYSKSNIAFIIKSKINYITYPYLYEENKKLLSTWEPNVFGPIFEKILKFFVNNSKIRFTFFFIHTILYTIISFIMSLILVNIAFFHGDLRHIFYFIPLSFLSWIYRHFFYYFYEFVKFNIKTLKEYIEIKIIKEPYLEENDILSFDTKDLLFNLNDKAKMEFSENYDKETLLNNLTENFLLLCRFNVYYKQYQYYFYFFQYIIIGLRVLAWIKISLLFFPTIDSLIAVNLLTKFISGPIVYRSYATKAYFLKKASETAFEKKTNGDFKSGHPIAADEAKIDSNGIVHYHLQFTHGKGPITNPSKPLSYSHDVKGNPIPQNGVYPKSPVKIFQSDLGKEIPGSQQYFKQQEVKDNHKLNRGKDGEDF